MYVYKRQMLPLSVKSKFGLETGEILFKARSAFNANGAKQRQLVEGAAEVMTGVATAGRHLLVAHATASCYTIASIHYGHTID